VQGDTRGQIIATAQRIMARKGYSAVGINEVLTAAGVPKGSFYHYFASKDAFGEAMLQHYFADYLVEMDDIIGRDEQPADERLMAYWRHWRETQSVEDCQGRCLAVKLGAEVADLSESMRLTLKQGTDAIVDRLEKVIVVGMRDGNLTVDGDPREVAQSLYNLWLGASVMAKIHRDVTPLDLATATTRNLLHLR
jgi:TetR/AcrR family transcriptional repressor of nem operon